MKKLVINKNKNQLIRENRLRSDQILYLLINSIIDIAEKEEIESDYVEILKRIRDENYSKLKNKGGSKLIDKEWQYWMNYWLCFKKYKNI